MKTGFYPLPGQEADACVFFLHYPEEFAALDPCVGNGVAFSRMLEGTTAPSYGIEIDAYRAEQDMRLNINCAYRSAGRRQKAIAQPPHSCTLFRLSSRKLRAVRL